MDRLASEGAFFRNAFLTTPICAASRASIFSGLYERTHKYTFQTGPIRDEYMQYSYPRVLRDAGYYTGFYGKFGVNYNHPDRLFDVYEDYDRDNRYKDRRGYFFKTLGKDTVHGSIHANMLPLAFDIVPEEYREPVVKHVKSRGMGCSVYWAQFLLDGLQVSQARTGHNPD